MAARLSGMIPSRVISTPTRRSNARLPRTASTPSQKMHRQATDSPRSRFASASLSRMAKPQDLAEQDSAVRLHGK